LWANESMIAAETAQRVLPAAAYALFRAMTAGDQLHALGVLRLLRQRGNPSPALEQAALLHDVGKAGGGLTLAYRAVIVLLKSLHPSLLERLARAEPGSWRYPFEVQLRHAERGAAQCEQAGCSPLTVALVRHHEDRALDELGQVAWRDDLIALQKADDAC